MRAHLRLPLWDRLCDLRPMAQSRSLPGHGISRRCGDRSTLISPPGARGDLMFTMNQLPKIWKAHPRFRKGTAPVRNRRRERDGIIPISRNGLGPNGRIARDGERDLLKISWAVIRTRPLVERPCVGSCSEPLTRPAEADAAPRGLRRVTSLRREDYETT